MVPAVDYPGSGTGSHTACSRLDGSSDCSVAAGVNDPHLSQYWKEYLGTAMDSVAGWWYVKGKQGRQQ